MHCTSAEHLRKNQEYSNYWTVCPPQAVTNLLNRSDFYTYPYAVVPPLYDIQRTTGNILSAPSRDTTLQVCRYSFYHNCGILEYLQSFKVFRSRPVDYSTAAVSPKFRFPRAELIRLTRNYINEESTKTRTTGWAKTSRLYFVPSLSDFVVDHIHHQGLSVRTMTRASLCLHIPFLWPKRCMLWTNFVACTGHCRWADVFVVFIARAFFYLQFSKQWVLKIEENIYVANSGRRNNVSAPSRYMGMTL